ncbi:MAG: glutamate-5-semialdehyde dehydrogenase [Pseudomonadales bacterium]|jgi:glutamate-5-semialdehyde dehydrogenase|nr:glutamate-5-semialdehyde dehydrogenase [Pseudomonadales bacterium]
MTVKEYMHSLGITAKSATAAACRASTSEKNAALQEIANAIRTHSDMIVAANSKDLKRASAAGLDAASLDRLALKEQTLSDMICGLEQMVDLPDPVGQMSDYTVRPNGLRISKMRVPIGVIGMIYESRPNVTIDAAGLCLKSGNAVILRGGSESIESNRALYQCIYEGLQKSGLDTGIIQLVDTIDRQAVGELLKMSEYVDLIIPRGGKSLIQRISDETRIAVLKHLDGVCHVFIDAEANLESAYAIAMNAKTQRYATCNTMETLLVDREVADRVLPDLAHALCGEGVELRVCQETASMLNGITDYVEATDADWREEYNAPILSIKICAGLEEAIQHIGKYGSNHTDAIVTENAGKADRFLREIDSSSVMVNTSTRFADGFEYGLGAEIGISTDKLHARGPVGLEGLTSQKFIVRGEGQIR